MSTSGELSAAELEALGARLRDLTGVAYELRGSHGASTGFANSTWFIDATPTDVVIKVQTSPSAVFDRDPALEPAALAALAGTPVPVPAVLACDPDGAVLDAPWFAMTRVDGTGMPDDGMTGYAAAGWFAETEPSRRTAIWNGFVDRLADLHSLPAATFSAVGRGGSHARVLDYWDASVHDVLDPGEAPVQERALAWLRDHAPSLDATYVRPCMGDARMANLLERDGEVMALVDWELAHVGDPRGDLAYHLYMDARYAASTGTRLEGLPSADDTWQRWADGTGLAVGDPHYWTVFAALFIAVTASRSIRFALGSATADVEAMNPFVPDIARLIDHGH